MKTKEDIAKDFEEYLRELSSDVLSLMNKYYSKRRSVEKQINDLSEKETKKPDNPQKIK